MTRAEANEVKQTRDAGNLELGGGNPWLEPREMIVIMNAPDFDFNDLEDLRF